MACLTFFGLSLPAQAAVSVATSFLQQLVLPVGSPETAVTTAVQGDVLTLKIALQNGSGALIGGALTDALPPGMVLAPNPNPRATATCGAPIYSALPGATSFGFTAAQVPAGTVNGPQGLCSIYVDVTVPLTAALIAAGGNATLNNTIPGGGFTATDTSVNLPISNINPASLTLLVTVLRNLTVAKTFAPATVPLGEPSTVQIVLTNPNAAAAVNLLALTDALPAGLTATGPPTLTGAGCGAATVAASANTGTVTLSLTGLTLAGNASCTISWPMQVTAPIGTLTNTIPANSLINSRGLLQNAANATLTIRAPLNGPTKALAPTTAATLQPVALTIRLPNSSTTQTLSAVTFTDAFPAGMTLSPGPVTLTGCGAATVTPTNAVGTETSLVLNGGTILPNGTCQITANVQVATPGPYTNTIPSITYVSNNPLVVGTQTVGPISANLTAYSQFTIASKAARDPRPAMNAAAGNLVPANLARFQIVLNNYSSAIQSGISFIDPLPVSGGAQITYVGTPAPVFTNCGAPTVNAANPAVAQFDGITMAAGNSAAPTTCQIDFWALVPAGWTVGTRVANGSTMDLQQNGVSMLQGVRPATNVQTVAPLTVTKAVSRPTIAQGELSLLTITLTNNNYVDITGAQLLDSPLFGSTTLGEVRLADLPGAATTCGGTPVFGAVGGDTTFSASGLTIPQRGNCTVSVWVRGVVAGGPYLNQIPAANVTGQIDVNGVITPVQAAGAATVNLTVTSVISAAKSFAPTSVASIGGTSRVTVQINNIGTAALTGVQVTDPLPAGLLLANPPNATTTCNGATVITAPVGGATATLQGATVAAGVPCLFQFDVTTDGTVGLTASVNTIPARTGVVADGGLFNVQASSATLNKVAPPQLSVRKSFAPATLTAVGEPSRLQVTIDNTAGTVPLTGLALTDNLPGGMVVAATPAPTTTCPGGVIDAVPGSSLVALSQGTLAPGASCVFEANVTLTSIGTHNNLLPTGAVRNNENVSNTAAFSANLQTQAAIGVQKSFNPVSVVVNQPSRLTIQLINAKDVAVTNLSVSDTLPAGVVPAVPNAASTTCPGGLVTVNGSTVTLTGASLPATPLNAPGQTCEVGLNVVSAMPGIYLNTIPAGGASAQDSVTTALMNNLVPTTATLEVRDAAVITKAFAAPNVRLGTANRLTITIGHPNNIPLTSVSLTDTLPANVSVALVPNAVTTCAGGLVTATPGATSVRLTGATVPAAGTCTVAVDVLSNVPGSYTNTIPDLALKSAEGVTNLLPASASFTTLNPPTLGKEFRPLQIASGGAAKLRLVLGNPNVTPLTLQAQLTDALPTSPAALAIGAPAIDTTTVDTLPRCAGVSTVAAPASIRVANGTVIPPGGCVVWINVTGTIAGVYSNVIAAGALITDGGTNPTPANAPLSISARNSIAGKVFLDDNNDGLPGTTEVGIGSQVIELINDLSPGVVVASTVTDSLGNFAFLDLADGSYTVRQRAAQPVIGGVTTLNGLTRAGQVGAGAPLGVATAVTVTPSQVSGIALAGTQNLTGLNFAELMPSALSGAVFVDRNNDGVLQGSDTPLAGQTIGLSGNDDLGNPVAQSAVTAADGSYRFAGLRPSGPGGYTLTQPNQPLLNGQPTYNGKTVAGTGATAPGTPTAVTVVPSVISGIGLLANQNAANYAFAELAGGRTLGGRVYIDVANDGLFNTGDTALSGVTVQLTGTDLNGQPLSLSQNTDANGQYIFANLPEGSYALNYLTAATPAGTSELMAYAGSAGGVGGGVASAAAAVRVSAIPLTGMVTAGSGYDFTRAAAASLSGRVYQDANNDGVYQPAPGGTDAGLPGVTVTLTGTDDLGVAVTKTGTTAADGSYSFTSLRPGTYAVTETEPAGLLNGRTTAGTAGGTATTLAVTPSAISAVVLRAGQAATGYEFAELGGSSLAGRVYQDANNDGVYQPAPGGTDASLPGVTVTLTGTDDLGVAVTKTATTAADGSYSFTSLRPGTYTVTETEPAGLLNGRTTAGTAGGTATTLAVTPSAISAVVLRAGQAATGYEFAELGGSSLSGRVYQDANNDGVYQPAPGGTDTGLPGVTVTLTGTDDLGVAVTKTGTTAADGSYSFTSLRPGTYAVTETEPAGLLNGRTTAGTAGGTATTLAVTPSAISAVVLRAGQAATGYEFAELGGGSLAGRVYQDANNDGVYQPAPGGTDTGLPGVPVTLTGTDDLGVAVTKTGTTAADGSYSFTSLRPGTYTVTETEPVGLLNGKTTAGTAGGTATTLAVTPSAISAVVLRAGQAATGYEFAELGGGSLAGRVYQDANNDGVYQPAPGGTDAGLPGVTVTLTGTDDLGVAVTKTATTAADGSYSFTSLRPGSYTVTETEPAGLLNGRTTAGTAGGTATTLAVTPSAISAVVLRAGQAATGYEFAELGGSSLSGRVYQDANNDGVYQPAPGGTDTGLAGVTVTLTGTDDLGAAVTKTATTAADGSYSFTSLRPGTYTVTETEPAGLLNGRTTAGTAGGTATTLAVTPSAISAVVLRAGQAATGYEFAELGGGSLSGRVYQDANNDGIYQPTPGGTDAGLPGVTVTLTGTDDLGVAVNRTTTTAADGSYSFTSLRPGSYTVTETEPAGLLNGRTTAGTAGGTATTLAVTPSAISAVVLRAGQAATGYEFAELGGSSLSGRVYQDANNDGVYQPAPGGTDAGLAGVTVTLTGTDDLGAAVTKTATTAADGSYSFTSLRPGTYAVTETEPVGLLNGKTTAGTAGGTATTLAVTPSAIGAVVLRAGQAATGYEFAELGGSSLAGRVYQDANNDGVYQPAPGGTDASLPGVTVTLTGTDDLGVAVTKTATTAADGSYSFTSLRPGTYTVTETEPAGLLNGRTTAGTAGGTATTLAVTPSAISAVVLRAGQAATGYEFAELGGGSLAGRVYQDANNDGVYQPAPGGTDTGLAGVTVTLTGTDDVGSVVNRTTTTAADGSYSFTSLRPGTYTVTEPNQPVGTIDGPVQVGQIGAQTVGVAAAGLPSAIQGITLAAAQQGSGYDFLELPETADLSVSKTHEPPRFTVGQPALYRLKVRNAGPTASAGLITVSDRLPAGMTLAAVPTGAGWQCAGAVGASSFSCTTTQVVAAAGLASEIVAPVSVSAALLSQGAATGQADNVVMVEGGGEAPVRQPTPLERTRFTTTPGGLPPCDPALAQNACRDTTPVQLPASLSGSVWVDSGTQPQALDAGDMKLQNWTVEAVDVATGQVIAQAITARDGSYQITGLPPTVPLDVRFRDPMNHVVFGVPMNGETGPGSSGVGCLDFTVVPVGQESSCLDTTSNVSQLRVILAPGHNLVQQSLPVDPNGVVYDSQTRAPLTGAVVTLAPQGSCPGWNPTTSVVNATAGGYTVSGNTISMNTGTDGFYQFLFLPTAPALCDFQLTVTPPGGYVGPSTAIPPEAGVLVPPVVPGAIYQVQPQPTPPTAAVGVATRYWTTLRAGSAGANIVHNNIALDPQESPRLAISKVADLREVEVGSSVRYTLTVRQTAGSGLAQLAIEDRLPAGFTFIRGTALLDGVPIADPVGAPGPRLRFALNAISKGAQQVLTYRVRVGVGALEGDGINRAHAVGCAAGVNCIGVSSPPTGTTTSNEAQAKVKVTGGVFATEACIVGKIFIDCNHNHLQDDEELGIPGVRFYLEDGTWLVSDSEGKYSLCGLTPQSHVIRPDPRTLPRGAALTTTSNRNLGDAGSLWLDLRNGELHRADFIEGSCSNRVLDQVKARRMQGEVRSVETERPGGPALRFESKAHGLDPSRAPPQATDSADQRPAIVAPRSGAEQPQGGRDAR